MRTPEQIAALQASLTAKLEELRALVAEGAGYKITLVMRAPHLADGDIILSQEDTAAGVQAIQSGIEWWAQSVGILFEDAPTPDAKDTVH